MMFDRLRSALLALVIAWSAIFPFAAEAMERVSGDNGWLLCAGQVRSSISDEDAANLAILSQLAGAGAPRDATLPMSCDDCLSCPPLALSVPTLSHAPVPAARAQPSTVAVQTVPFAAVRTLRPEPRAPPRIDLI